ncbi:MAG: thrombospondin type 3 repeat-/CalX-beta domain-containing protein, partial [Thalassotalea sp.]
FTQITLDQLRNFSRLTANDGRDGNDCCEITPVGLQNDVMNLPAGKNTITWRTQDTAGNVSTAEQVINIYPLVNVELQQFTAEGNNIRIPVFLSGNAPHYPVVIPFEITGTVDSLDYSVDSAAVTINSGTEGFIDVFIKQDFQTEADEELVFTLDNNVNLGAQRVHTVTISDQNVTPTVDISIVQQQQVTTIAKDNGEVMITLTINDANITDQHLISWNIPEYANADISANQFNVHIPAADITLPEADKGLLSLSVTVTDNGSGELSQTVNLAIPVVDSYARLSTTDTDNDGITDNLEGFVDADKDGIPDFMDKSNLGYIQQLHVNSSLTKLMETEPGLKITLGKYAKLQLSDGVQLTTQEINNTQLVAGDELTHQSEYFDFEIHNIKPFGRSVAFILPLVDGIPQFATYRKFSQVNGWQSFIEDAQNTIASAAQIVGVCPPLTSNLYRSGLNAGDHCVLINIEDGGVNDADGIANGIVEDPGVIAIIPNVEIAKKTDPETESSGGSVSLFMLLSLALIRLRKRFYLL